MVYNIIILTLKMYDIIFAKVLLRKLELDQKNDFVHFQGKIEFRCDTFVGLQTTLQSKTKKLKFSFMCTSLSHAYV